MEVISTRRYEARAPANKIHSGLLYDPSNAVATVKEEEWETRKKKEITTTRQIETRVKRQVVLEDGAVVKDSGPLVTTNTTEDVEQQEHTTQERRTNGDEPKEVEWTDRSGDSAVVQKELNQTIVRSREEIEELVETEDRHQFGDITDETYQQAVRNNRGDLRISLAESAKQVAVNSGPRLVQHETKSNKVIDTEKTWERKELKADGAIVTETKKSVEHEEIRDNELPEDDKNVPDEYLEIKKESSQRFLKEKHEDVVDHVSGGERIARETRYVSERTEGERIGDWPPPPPTMKTVRLPKPGESSPLDRKDALTKEPLDPEEEDEARKFETSKWLENHFGSESRSSHSDSIELNDPPKQTSTNTSFINVTMKSCTSRDRDYKNTSNSSLLRNPNRSNNRESSSPLGYFYGISEWSERYQGSGDKRNHNSNIQTSSPKHYAGETTRTTGNRQTPEAVVTYARNYSTSSRKHHETQQRSSPPSPPLRRRAREPISKKGERTSHDIHSINSSSPINVTQRTWQSRNLEYPMEEKIYTCQKSRSPSPISKKSVRKELEKSNDTCETPRNTSKFKIGESFRKLVDKLRSASSERTNKKIATNSTSQLTQTDDSSTYLQYNVIDKNIPEIGNGEVNESIDKPPERPSRSPRVSSQPTMIKVTRSTGQKTSPNTDQSERNHKYGITEETYLHNFSKSEPQDSRHDRINSYQERHGKSSLRNDIDNNCTSRTLGRLSKSTSRLTHEYDRDNYYPSILTLPRKLHSTSHGKRQQTSSTRRSTPKQQNPISGKTNQSRHYGSMINISIKNAVTSQIPPNSKTFPQQNDPPIKPERTYKSALLRSKSFNVEATNGGCKIPYKSSNQLNRLDQSQPLKSPGILASISRSNRDLFKHDYY